MPHGQPQRPRLQSVERYVELEAFVEDRIERVLLHLRLALAALRFVREQVHFNVRIGSVALGVDGRQIAALLDQDFEGARFVIVLQSEFDLSFYGDRAFTAEGARINAGHRIGTQLQII